MGFRDEDAPFRIVRPRDQWSEVEDLGEDGNVLNEHENLLPEYMV